MGGNQCGGGEVESGDPAYAFHTVSKVILRVARRAKIAPRCRSCAKASHQVRTRRSFSERTRAITFPCAKAWQNGGRLLRGSPRSRCRTRWPARPAQDYPIASQDTAFPGRAGRRSLPLVALRQSLCLRLSDRGSGRRRARPWLRNTRAPETPPPPSARASAN